MKITNILIVVLISYFLLLGFLFYYAMSNDVTGVYIIGIFEILCILGLIVLFMHRKDLKNIN